MATPLDMQPIVDTQIDSPKSNILAQVSEACKKLGIAVATAAALHCSPAFSQSASNQSPAATLQATKGLGYTVDIGGKKMSFMEIAALPDAEKEDVLTKLKPSQQARFHEWVLEAANQTEKKIDISIDLSKQLGITLDEVFAEQGLTVVATPEIVEKNKKRGAIILSALANPLIGGKLPSTSQGVLKILGESLVKGNSPAYASQKIANAMKADIKNIQ